MKLLNFEMVGTLADGTSVSLDEYAVGGTLSIVNADGTKTAAPDGDYSFSDGSVATVSGGKITAITNSTGDAQTDSTSQVTGTNPTDTNDTSTGESEAEQAGNTPTDSDAATEQAAEDEDEDGEITDQIMAIEQQISKMAADIAALQASNSLMSSELEKHKVMTDEKFSAVSIPSAISGKSNVNQKPKTKADEVVERIKTLYK